MGFLVEQNFFKIVVFILILVYFYPFWVCLRIMMSKAYSIHYARTPWAVLLRDLFGVERCAKITRFIFAPLVAFVCLLMIILLLYILFLSFFSS